MTDAALEPDTSRVVRWGALSLLGTLSQAYNAKLGIELSANHASQAIGAAAYELLGRVHDDTDVDAVRAFSAHMLQQEPAPAEDIAIELLDLTDKVDRLVIQDDDCEADLSEEALADEQKEETIIGDATPMDIARLNIKPNLLERMHWITLPSDNQLPVRPVRAGGTVVAYAVDLLNCNPNIAKESRSLEAFPDIAANAWQGLGSTIVRYVHTASAPRLSPQTMPVPMLASKSYGNNHILTRSYFTPFGKYGGLPVVGIVAMARTKEGQGNVLKTIATSPAAYRKSML